MSYSQTIYNKLRQAGMTEAGALGVLGNFWCESNCEPERLQGDYNSYRTSSKEYTRRADNGQMTEDEFAKPIGYGLAQWTYGQRKRNLWKFWKQYGGSIGNVDMQTEFAIKEFKSDFIADWRLLCSTGDIYEATKAVCYRFENPAVKNVDARFQAATRIKAEINLNAFGDAAPVQPEMPVTDPNAPAWEKIPATEYWSPRVLCKGMTGADVEVLQAVLKARGWTSNNPDGIFGSYLENIVKDFQEAYKLDVDGIVGNQTWTKLLERG